MYVCIDNERPSENGIVLSDGLISYGGYIFHFRLNTALRGSP